MQNLLSIGAGTHVQKLVQICALKWHMLVCKIICLQVTEHKMEGGANMSAKLPHSSVQNYLLSGGSDVVMRKKKGIEP